MLYFFQEMKPIYEEHDRLHASEPICYLEGIENVYQRIPFFQTIKWKYVADTEIPTYANISEAQVELRNTQLLLKLASRPHWKELPVDALKWEFRIHFFQFFNIRQKMISSYFSN